MTFSYIIYYTFCICSLSHICLFFIVNHDAQNDLQSIDNIISQNHINNWRILWNTVHLFGRSPTWNKHCSNQLPLISSFGTNRMKQSNLTWICILENATVEDHLCSTPEEWRRYESVSFHRPVCSRLVILLIPSTWFC